MILFAAGLSFGLRASIATELASEILSTIDADHAGEMAGTLLGNAFLSFAVTLLAGSIFLEKIGMGRMLVMSGLAFATGTGLTVAAPIIASGDVVYTWLRLGFLLSGIGWGFMEASVNPLTAALYPEDKTHRLNVLHAWWPMGIMVGGLWALGLAELGFGWQYQLALVIVPSIAGVALCLGTPFPTTERAAMGMDWGEMWDELVRRPMFLVWFACMFLTAASELAPGQWIDLTLTRTLGMRGIWVMIYVSLMMFILRHFAGPIVQRIRPVGLLTLSVVLATAGLLLLPMANSLWTGLGAATVWGLGVCFLWPTMLANVSERYPRGGELFVGLLGFAGAMAIQFVLPVLGRIFDTAKHDIAGGKTAFAMLDATALDEVLRGAAQTSFETLAWCPAILIVVFGSIWLYDRSQSSEA
ncbi:MAG: MFS transporter [Polyangiaceae bacterium]